MPSGLLCPRTRWLVFKLSICFLNRTVHRSLHKNLITSRLSLKRGRSRENLQSAQEASVTLTPKGCVCVVHAGLLRGLNHSPQEWEKGNGAVGTLLNTFLRDLVLPGTPESRGGSMLTL